MLYPVKNLLPPTSNPLWAKHANASAAGEYRWKIDQTGTYQTTSIPVTLKAGVVYTLSADGMTDKAQLYVKRVIDGVSAYHIVSVSSGLSISFTAVAGATYSVEFHNGTTLGEGYVYNYQLEEGYKTPFEPYRLGNKKAAMPKETINSDMSGASSHVYPYGNVIQVKEDVRLWGYKIQVGTPTGTFDSVIYEWNNGAIGEPLFREVVNTSASGVLNLSYKGTLLKAGKKYYIGRNDPNRNNDSTGNAGVYRKTGMPPADFKYISTLGGSQFYSPAIDFPSTWYYIFGLDIESTKNKPANIYTKNLAPPLSNPNWFVKSGQAKGVIVNDYEYKMNIGVVGVVGYDIPITLKPNTTYTLGATLIGTGARMRLMRASDDSFLVNLNPSSPVQTYTTTALTDYKIRIENNGQAGDYTTKDFFIYEGNVVNPVFEPMKFGNKPLIFNPRKSLIPNFLDSGWFGDTSAGGGTMVVDPTDPYKMKLTNTQSAQGRLIHIPVETGKTYTFSFGKMEGLYRLYKRKVNVHDVAMTLVQHAGVGLPTSFTFTPDSDYQGFVTLRLTSSWAGTMAFEQLKLEEGPDKTPFQLYVNNMKPAVLYPQKNLIKSFDEMYLNSFTLVSKTNDYKAIYRSIGTNSNSYFTLDAELNTDYTFSMDIPDDMQLGVFSSDGSSAIVGYSSAKSVTFNSGNRNKIRCYVRQTVGAVTFELSNPMIEKGGKKTPFEPIKYGNKK
jgi:hypothetical protein